MINSSGIQTDRREDWACAGLGERATALMIAAYYGHYEMVQPLLSWGANVDSFDKQRFNALSIATVHGNDEIVRLLLNGGAHVDARVNHTWTSLTYAAHMGEVETARVLLDSGASIEAKKREALRHCWKQRG